MAEDKSEGGGGSPGLNLNSLFALLTLAGGLWLVSHRLSSSRPVAPAAGTREFIGEQTMEARLWEDPFKTVEKQGGRDGKDAIETDLKSWANLAMMVEQIHERNKSPHRVLLLPVMLSGGHYSEDQESRIRSRFAIVSALGQSGYAPEDAEHIGALTIPWPRQHEVDLVKQTNWLGGNLWQPTNSYGPKLRSGRTSSLLQGTNDCPLGMPTSFKMELRFEWYKSREFFHHQGTNNMQTNVLVLWLDDSFFEDDPLLRLPLLLEPLTDPRSFKRINPPAVALIGPRRSATLRAMLQELPAGKDSLSEANPNLWLSAVRTLTNIPIYCATPSAMDEVLVTNRDGQPRQAVKAAMEMHFESFYNFAATDAQLAQEVFDELALGNTDLKDVNNHVVLISEWDTFYARVLSLTYAAELAKLQQAITSINSRYDFVQAYIGATQVMKNWMPTNFHSFVYLRGLDGQTVKGEGGAGDDSSEGDHTSKPSPGSIEELRNWTPDANKAEGQAQFDYLSRLGGQLSDLAEQLHRDNRGHIEAIGIVGSDVYDTLLILQALRDKFPDAKFFTTDLDARFYQPREHKWTRDLLVVSAYGLALHPSLQKEVPPFRDSTQTAQFAAALAALGDTNLFELAFVPPRRFEIGSRAVVDLSVSSAMLPMIHSHADTTNGPWLHPLTLSEAYPLHQSHVRIHALGIVGYSLLVLLACSFWGPLRRLTWEGFRFPPEALVYSQEDIGGPEGAEALLSQLRSCPKSNFEWMREELLERFRASGSSSSAANLHVPVGSQGRQQANPAEAYYSSLLEKGRLAQETAKELKDRREHEQRLNEQAGALVTLLNRMLKCQKSPPERDVKKERRVPQSAWEEIRPCFLPAPFWRAMRRLEKRYRVRRSLDACLEELSATLCTPSSGRENFEIAALHAADAARESSREIFRLRCERLVYFWAGVVIFGVLAFGLGYAIWHDTFGIPNGEPFSLTNGASEWPAEILRLGVCAAAIYFSFGLYSRMRETFFRLTREFRLSFLAVKDGSLDDLRRTPTLVQRPITAQRPSLRAGLGQLGSLLGQLVREGLRFFQSSKVTESTNGVCVLKIWSYYRENGRLSQRLVRVTLPLLLYVLLCGMTFDLFHQNPFDDVRGSTALWCNRCLVLGSGFLFVALAFLTMDAALLCRRFIQQLSSGETNYPQATSRHFSGKLGNLSKDCLNEWIDTNLIAELTEGVGRLVFYPCWLLFALVLARNGWWDTLSWPTALIFLIGFNLLLALASTFILQGAAKEAKRDAEQSLTAKVKLLQARTAPSAEQNQADQAKTLLDDIRALQRGAFRPFWQNPVVEAVSLSTGGMTLLQVLIWFMGR